MDLEGEDFYMEGEYIVFTSRYHIKRGYCCGSGCRHCPYEPRWTRGGTKRADESPLDILDINEAGIIDPDSSGENQ